MRYEHPFTLVYFDLDNFKDVNDKFGHKMGDKLLQKHYKKSSKTIFVILMY